jgi:hypothetical protein
MLNADLFGAMPAYGAGHFLQDYRPPFSTYVAALQAALFERRKAKKLCASTKTLVWLSFNPSRQRMPVADATGTDLKLL